MYEYTCVVEMTMTRSRLVNICAIKDDNTEENTFEILQHSDININNSLDECLPEVTEAYL